MSSSGEQANVFWKALAYLNGRSRNGEHLWNRNQSPPTPDNDKYEEVTEFDGWKFRTKMHNEIEETKRRVSLSFNPLHYQLIPRDFSGDGKGSDPENAISALGNPLKNSTVEKPSREEENTCMTIDSTRCLLIYVSGSTLLKSVSS